MGICKKCGRRGLFLLIGLDGLCTDCRKAVRAADQAVRQINQQIKRLDGERDFALSAQDLTPQQADGYARSYHYKDVNVWVDWQYGGQYGKSCASIGMRRGDEVELVPHRRKDDPEQISIRWHGIEVANMKTNRMRSMVHQWQAAKLPVRCAVAAVGGEQKLLLEFSFYGRPNSEASRKRTAPKVGPGLIKSADKSRSQFIAFDVETTGLDCENDRIVEISAIRFLNWMPEETFTTLICTDRKISPKASAVNGITQETLNGAPTEQEAMAAFSDFIGPDAVSGHVLMVAHNAPFDKAFVEAALFRCGISSKLKCEDTLKMSRILLPGLDGYTLSKVACALNIEQKQAHRAADDALVCGKIFVSLAKTALEQKGPDCQGKQDITPLEREVCEWIYTTLQKSGCDTEHLSFNVSTYLSVNCWHRVARLKLRAKKPYILVPQDLQLPDRCETAPATKSEGEDLKRVFFTSAQDLSVFSDWMVTEYIPISVETAQYWRMGNPYRREIQEMKDRQYRPYI